MTKEKRSTTGVQNGIAQKMNDSSKILILEGRRRALQRVKAHIRKEQKRPGFRRKARSKSVLCREKVVNHPKPWDDTACTRNTTDSCKRNYAASMCSNKSTRKTFNCNNESKIKYEKERNGIQYSNKENTESWSKTYREDSQSASKLPRSFKNRQNISSLHGLNKIYSNMPM